MVELFLSGMDVEMTPSLSLLADYTTDCTLESYESVDYINLQTRSIYLASTHSSKVGMPIITSFVSD